MTLLVGMDEAGFGPLLGPLVVSSTAFSVPDNRVQTDLWPLLSRSVGRQRKHLAGRLLICDSKKAYTRTVGIHHLQRTVLAVLSCLGIRPRSLAELLRLLDEDCLRRLGGCPWYQDLDAVLLPVDDPDTAIAGSTFAGDMQAHETRMVGLTSKCLDVAHYNQLVESVRNKADILFSTGCALIQYHWDHCPCEKMQVIVDRQGGRTFYRGSLQKMFPHMQMTVLAEDANTSSYELQAGGRCMRIHYVVGADGRFLPVALASMVSKYVRELCMGCLNAYFRKQDGELRPTGGYWQDGQRFIKELQSRALDVNIDRRQLVRSR